MSSKWSALTLMTLASFALFVFMEWLFQVTKPSFLTAMSPGQRASVLGAGMVVSALWAGGFLLPFQLLAWIFRTGNTRKLVGAVARVPAAVAFGALGFLLVDNFTYTVFGWGVQSTASAASRGAYLLLLAGLVGGSYGLVGRSTRSARWESPRWRWLGRRLPAVCAVGAALLVASGRPAGNSAATMGSTPEPSRRPNILLFSGDGIDADHMSAYGYERRTTPALERLASTSLVSENNFPNAAHTGASIASILTGRLPTETGLVYPPDILKGQDSYRHLPGILKRHGYSTVSITLRHYADAYDLNLREGFDQSNFRSQGTYRAAWLASGALGPAAAYFTEIMIDRLVGRLQHLTGISEMNEAVAEVALAGVDRKNDSRRVAGLSAFLEGADRPFFAQIHLLATHGPEFGPEVVAFSEGRRQRREWDLDFYDDAILTVDRYYARIEKRLRDLGLWKDTVVVVFSDHGMQFSTDTRTPLVFRFPDDEHASRVTTNTSNLDIAPTLLDYLSLPIPGWMSGTSLLQGDPRRDRLVLSAKKTSTGAQGTAAGWQLDPRQAGPPFYSLGTITAIACQRAYRLGLDERRLRVSDIEEHTSPCDNSQLPKAEAVERFLVSHLANNGYDVSGIELPLRKRYSGIRRRDR